MRVIWLALAFACGCSQPRPCVLPTQRTTTYITKAITLPRSSEDFAIDLNGDGTRDNRLANLVGGDRIGAQTALSIEIADGELAPRWIVSSDGTNETAGIALDDPMAAELCATRNGEHLVTEASPNPPVISLALPFPEGDAVPLHVARVSFTADGTTLDAVVSTAIREDDVQSHLLPNIQSLLQANIARDAQISTFFDNGDFDGGCCTNPDGCNTSDCGACPNDRQISTCEIAGSYILSGLLAPDVQLFAADGSWAPNPENTKPDSLSFGFGVVATAQVSP